MKNPVVTVSQCCRGDGRARRSASEGVFKTAVSVVCWQKKSDCRGNRGRWSIAGGQEVELKWKTTQEVWG